MSISDQTRRAVSEANRRRVWTDESRRKSSQTLRGRKFTEEHKRKISEALKGRQAPNVGKKLSAGHKRKISEVLQGRVFTDEWKSKISVLLIGKPVWNKGRPWSDEIRGKFRLNWENLTSEQRSARVSKMRRRRKPNSIEKVVHYILYKLCVDFSTEVGIGGYIVDILVHKWNLVIECDGVYWHSLPGVPERDKRRDSDLEALGYSVLRISEIDIRSGTFWRQLLVFLYNAPYQRGTYQSIGFTRRAP